MLRIQQIILLAGGAVLVILLFLFGKTHLTGDQPVATVGNTVSPGKVTVDFSSILQKAKTTLSKPKRDSIEVMELGLNKVRGEKEKAAMLRSLGEQWSNTGNVIVAGKYFEDAAGIDQEIKTWEEAATRFYIGFPNAADTLTKIYAVQEAINSYKQLHRLDSSNLDYQVREAVCYIDGLGQVMEGVSLLKQVERKDSNNHDMNLILGRLAVVSGQYDKAINRLEKLIRLDPNNAEAYFHLAEAYRALGRKEEAIKALEHCKLLVSDSGFSAQIDSYINQIKNQ